MSDEGAIVPLRGRREDEERRIEAARDRWKAGEQSPDEYVGLLCVRAARAIREEDLATANAVLKAAKGLRSQHAWEVHFLRAELFAKQGADDEARVAADEAITVAPDHALSYVRQGRILLELDDAHAARRCVAKALYFDEDCGEAYALRAELRTQKLDWEMPGSRFDDYSEALRCDPTNLEWRLARSRCAGGTRERNDIALSDIEYALSVEPKRWAFREHHARLLTALDRKEDALAAWAALLRDAPNDARATLEYAELLCQLSRHQEALDCVRQLAERCPRSAEAWSAVADILQSIDLANDGPCRFERERERCLRRARDLGDSKDAWWEWAHHASFGAKRGGRAVWTLYLDRWPRSARGWFQRSRYQDGPGQKRDLDRSLALDPIDYDVLEARAEWFTKRRRFDEAAADLREALEVRELYDDPLAGSHIDAHLAEVLAEQHAHTRSRAKRAAIRAECEELLRKAGSFWIDLGFYRARAYFRWIDGDRRGAMRDLRGLVRADPRDPTSRMLLAQHALECGAPSRVKAALAWCIRAKRGDREAMAFLRKHKLTIRPLRKRTPRPRPKPTLVA